MSNSDLKTLKRLLKSDVSAFPTIKMSLVGDTATQLLATAIQGMGVERGYNIDLFEADYNQVERQVLDPTSELHQFGAKYAVVFQSTHKMMEQFSISPQSNRVGFADERLQFVRTLCESTEGKIIYFNYPEIDDCVFGQYANRVEESFV